MVAGPEGQQKFAALLSLCKPNTLLPLTYYWCRVTVPGLKIHQNQNSYKNSNGEKSLKIMCNISLWFIHSKKDKENCQNKVKLMLLGKASSFLLLQESLMKHQYILQIILGLFFCQRQISIKKIYPFKLRSH